MATYYVLQNSNLPSNETVTVRREDWQTLSPEWAASGWTVKSSYSDTGGTTNPLAPVVYDGTNFIANGATISVSGGSVTKANVIATGLAANDIGAAAKSANLGDLVNASTARTNLGLGTAATHAATDFMTTAQIIAEGVVVPTSGAPINSLGDDGYYALDVASGVIYGPKSSGAWPATPTHVASAIGYGPSDNSIIAATCDLGLVSNTGLLPASGTVQTCRMRYPAAVPLTNIIIDINTAGATLTSGQCFAGIYQNGTLLGTTADQSTNWATTGLKTMALTAPVTPAAGYIDVAFLWNGTTAPKLYMVGFTPLVNLNLTGTALRAATANTSQTSLPSTLGTKTASNNLYFAAVS